MSSWQGFSSQMRKMTSKVKQSLPEIVIETTENYWKTFTSPNPDIAAKIFGRDGLQVGRATYAFSPLSDRIYVFEIEMDIRYRRQGYGTALLLHLAQEYGQPITAIKELFSASEFWEQMRMLKGSGLVVTSPLSVGEMNSEALRWQHLKPEIDLLNSTITERLSIHREPWHVAIGRGLE